MWTRLFNVRDKETMRYTVILTIQGLELGLYRVRINDHEGRVSCSMRTNPSPSFGSANTDVPHLCMVSRLRLTPYILWGWFEG